MFGAVDGSILMELGPNDPLVREFFGDTSWRVKPLDALPSEKFVADMVLIRLDSEMFAGETVAHGHIYNDSRGIFIDGDRVRTSAIKDIYVVDGETYIETRNTMYKLIDKT